MDASRVVAVAVLCFVRDTDQAMSEIARVLKPGGRVVIGELGAQSLSFAIYRRPAVQFVGTSDGKISALPVKPLMKRIVDGSETIEWE